MVRAYLSIAIGWPTLFSRLTVDLPAYLTFVEFVLPNAKQAAHGVEESPLAGTSWRPSVGRSPHAMAPLGSSLPVSSFQVIRRPLTRSTVAVKRASSVCLRVLNFRVFSAK